MAGPLPIAWLNGEFVALENARISPLDRGFLFADSVYEVLPVYGGRPFLFNAHIARLERSLAALGIPAPMDRAQWVTLLAELVERNGGGEQFVYLQVTRGAEFGRNHAPAAGLTPTVFLMATPLSAMDPSIRAQGVGAVTVADERWKRCDIKSTSLLPNVLAKGVAAAAGATEAILLAEGLLREGSSSSVMVVKDGVILVPPEGPHILPSTTRALALELALRSAIHVRIVDVSESQLRHADEVMLGFATRGVLPVCRIDGRAVGTGAPGVVWNRLQDAFDDYRAKASLLPMDQDA